MATNLRGVMAALLTPFDQQQALDKASLRRLVQFNRLNVMASMPSPPSRRSTILSALKNTAITIGQLLIRRMVCRWWCTTFQP